MFGKRIVTKTADQLKIDAKKLKATENTLKVRTLIIKKE